MHTHSVTEYGGQMGDGVGSRGLQDGPDADLLGEGVRVEGRGTPHAHDVERRRPRDLDGVDDLVADALDDRRHRHDGRDADHASEDREPRPQLVGAQLLERDRPTFGERVEPHSNLSATTGSSRAARAAGYTPNTIPARAPSPRAAATGNSRT